MDCCLLETGTRIEPFLDPIGETPVGNRPLTWWQRRTAEACGLRMTDGEATAGPRVLFADDLFLTRSMLEAFLTGLDGVAPDRPAVLRVADSAWLAQAAPLQGLALEPAGEPAAEPGDERASARLPLWYLPAGWQGPPPAPEDCDPVTVRPREKLARFPVPEHYFGRGELLVPLTTQAAMRLRHWSHLLVANRLGWALELLELPRWRLLLLLGQALLRAGIPTRSRLLRGISRIGRGCQVHPTAVLEGAILEDGVHVGPFAVVRFSRVGRGAWIQDRASVTLSVIGERGLVSAGSTVNLCVTYPEASASQILMQLSVLGRKAITTGGGFMMDMRFDRDVRVLHEGRAQDAGTRFLGSAVGHGAILGTGFWLAPGRAVPNGAVIVRHPDDVVRQVPAGIEPGTVLAARGGGLVPAR